ncbi:hypothetical protein [Phormidium tenue]|uniref:hypothetical protein n=1 Tax=Phormidium tenue TaxID=126344 RepID=UPI0030D7549B
MTTKRYKSILCGRLRLEIAVQPEQHNSEKKYPKIIHKQLRRQFRRRKQLALSA